MTEFRGILCATQAGCCAALASVSAKIATSAKASTVVVTILRDYLHAVSSLDITLYLEEGAICFRLLAVAGIFLFNAMMWVIFTKSMHLCSSTVEATAFNTASNFIFTAVAGKLMFGEHLGMQWCLGSALMVLGLLVLHKGGVEEAADQKKRDDLTEEETQQNKKKL